MLKYQKSRLHLLRFSFVVFCSLYRVFADFSSLILTFLQSITCHPTLCTVCEVKALHIWQMAELGRVREGVNGKRRNRRSSVVKGVVWHVV